MKRHLIAASAVLALFSVHSHAESFFQIEAGAGISNYIKTGPGIYYTPGFTHSTPVNAFAWRAGVVATPWQPLDVRPGLRIHADYINFGQVSWTAQAPQDEADFSAIGEKGGYSPTAHGCVANNCGQMSEFDSHGRIQALAFTFEPFWNVGHGFTVGIEAGPALYRSTWTANTRVETLGGTGKLGAIGSTSTLSAAHGLHVGALAGVSVSNGPWSVRYNFLYAPPHWGVQDNDLPSGVKSVMMLTVNYTF
jgi:hypothetical protein